MIERGSCREILAAHHAVDRHLVVGLDTDLARIPESLTGPTAADRVVDFNARIVEATADLVCAFKPNSAFYEALGADGFTALKRTIEIVHELAPDVAVIVDAKRADIGSTNLGYVKAIFDELDADAITVHPYLGREALAPFLERDEKLVFVLARTSNPGAGEFQDLPVDGVPLYRRVARAVSNEWNSARNCGLVVGATYVDELREIRTDIPSDVPILIPGIGAQGGDLDAVVAANREMGSSAFLINASRSVLFASDGNDFAQAARAEAEALTGAMAASR